MNRAAGNLTVKNLALLVLLVATAACGGRETSTPPAKTGAYSGPVLAGKAKQGDPRRGASADVGNLMPPYSGQWLDGRPFDLAAERDHVVFLNLWATWCGPCRGEMPYLQALQDQDG